MAVSSIRGLFSVDVGHILRVVYVGVTSLELRLAIYTAQKVALWILQQTVRALVLQQQRFRRYVIFLCHISTPLTRNSDVLLYYGAQHLPNAKVSP